MIREVLLLIGQWTVGALTNRPARWVLFVTVGGTVLFLAMAGPALAARRRFERSHAVVRECPELLLDAEAETLFIPVSDE